MREDVGAGDCPHFSTQDESAAKPRAEIAAPGPALYGEGRAGVAARPLRAGPVAQWLEPTAHNGLVGGSSPPGPTILVSVLCDLSRSASPSLPAGPMPFNRGEDRITLAAPLGCWPAVRGLAPGWFAASLAVSIHYPLQCGAISPNQAARISSRNASVISKPEALPITLSIPHSGHTAVCCARGLFGSAQLTI